MFKIEIHSTAWAKNTNSKTPPMYADQSERIADLLNQSIDYHKQINPNASYSNSNYWKSEEISKTAYSGNNAFLVVSDQTLSNTYNICAICLLTIDKPNNCIYIEELFVDKYYRGKGITSLIFKEIENMGKTIYIHELVLRVIPENKHALEVYKHLGYNDKYSIIEYNKKAYISTDISYLEDITFKITDNLYKILFRSTVSDEINHLPLKIRPSLKSALDNYIDLCHKHHSHIYHKDEVLSMHVLDAKIPGTCWVELLATHNKTLKKDTILRYVFSALYSRYDKILFRVFPEDIKIWNINSYGNICNNVLHKII